MKVTNSAFMLKEEIMIINVNLQDKPLLSCFFFERESIVGHLHDHFPCPVVCDPCHGPSIFMILTHISSIENFTMKKCAFIVGYCVAF